MSTYALYAFNVAFNDVTAARSSRSALSIDDATREVTASSTRCSFIAHLHPLVVQWSAS
jgi:hypothetical protein